MGARPVRLVEIRPGSGRARVGSVWVDLQPVPAGLQVGAGGPVLAPISLAQRSLLVREATGAGAVGAPAEVARAVAFAAGAGPETAREAVVQALALHLAGAGTTALGFAEVVLCVAARLPGGVASAMAAAEADTLAQAWRSSDPAPEAGGGSGWVAIRFGAGGDDAGAGGDVSPDEVAERLAEDLLQRAAAALPADGPGAPAAPADAAAAPSVPAPGASGAGPGGGWRWPAARPRATPTPAGAWPRAERSARPGPPGGPPAPEPLTPAPAGLAASTGSPALGPRSAWRSRPGEVEPAPEGAGLVPAPAGSSPDGGSLGRPPARDRFGGLVGPGASLTAMELPDPGHGAGAGPWPDRPWPDRPWADRSVPGRGVPSAAPIRRGPEGGYQPAADRSGPGNADHDVDIAGAVAAHLHGVADLRGLAR